MTMVYADNEDETAHETEVGGLLSMPLTSIDSKFNGCCADVHIAASAKMPE